MTLCIGAVSYQQRDIVLAGDFLLSSDLWSTETRVSKIEPISGTRRWLAAFAGDPTAWHDLLAHLRDALQDENESLRSVKAALRHAYGEVLKTKIEATMLAALGLTQEQFLRRGRQYLGDAEFSSLLYRMHRADAGIDVLIAGFEPEGAPRLITIGRPPDVAQCDQHERVGFCAIGTGAHLAVASLGAHYDSAETRTDVIYRVCEAKLAGEGARSVGQRTVVMLLPHRGEPTWIHPDRMAPIRQLCEANRPPVPPTAAAIIESQMGPFEWRYVSEEPGP